MRKTLSENDQFPSCEAPKVLSKITRYNRAHRDKVLIPFRGTHWIVPLLENKWWQAQTPLEDLIQAVVSLLFELTLILMNKNF